MKWKHLWISLRFLSAAVVAWLSLISLATAQQPELHWYKGNTHTHTINSDGDSAPDVVARWYREHDYQFLFITDHEYLTDPGPLNALLGQGTFLAVVGTRDHAIDRGFRNGLPPM